MSRACFFRSASGAPAGSLVRWRVCVNRVEHVRGVRVAIRGDVGLDDQGEATAAAGPLAEVPFRLAAERLDGDEQKRCGREQGGGQHTPGRVAPGVPCAECPQRAGRVGVKSLESQPDDSDPAGQQQAPAAEKRQGPELRVGLRIPGGHARC